MVIRTRGCGLPWPVRVTGGGEKIMSFGTVTVYKSKSALKAAVAEHGAENVMVVDTSMHGNQGTVSVASLAGTSAVIIGPDVYRDRRWYANVKIKKDGSIVIA
jgi:DeoR/GlpR family transcriptional regulator of sugar metabolism